ncbi:AraC family transcriptional regulator [Bernardetia sp. Wsw4-3y2]|uniref:AraC family transcriptional regulator n=1 Tax=Bernardetia sp. Wsw4-3y2 TaxID=3127471 RepID=UPI0030D4C5EC
MNNKFYFEKQFGLFYGKLNDNKLHRHYALQISLSIHDEIILKTEQKTYEQTNFFIPSRVKHQISNSEKQLIILINPLSCLGHQFYIKYDTSKVSFLSENLRNSLFKILKNYEDEQITFDNFCKEIKKSLLEYQCNCENNNHLEDDRIKKAIDFMDKNFEKILSMEQMADFCALSSTRFLHLFKEKTRLNFRRYQLWNKLIFSLPYLSSHSITETAHTFGFTDSSHYTRTFNETFGVTPKFFKLFSNQLKAK